MIVLELNELINYNKYKLFVTKTIFTTTIN